MHSVDIQKLKLIKQKYDHVSVQEKIVKVKTYFT